LHFGRLPIKISDYASAKIGTARANRNKLLSSGVGKRRWAFFDLLLAPSIGLQAAAKQRCQ